MKKTSSITILILILYSACSKQIELDFPELEPKLVVQSLFCPDSVFRVFISRTTDFNDSNVYFIDDATCKLYADGEYLFDFQYQDTGFYIAPDNYKPLSGVLYKIEITHPDLPLAWAEDSIPKFCPKIQNLYLQDSAELIASDDNSYYCTLVSFNMADLNNSENFYELEFEEKTDSFPFYPDTIFLEHDTIIRNFGWSKKHTPYGNDPIIINEGLTDFYPKAYPFSDILFDGMNHLFELQFCPKNYNIWEENEVVEFLAFYTLFVKIRSTSEAYYKFRKKLILHENNQQGDFWTGTGNPMQMYSNINGGYGIFAGYQEVVDSVRNY